MTPQEAQSWLHSQRYHITEFMEMMWNPLKGDALNERLDEWFGTDAWQKDHTFTYLGEMGDESLFVAWTQAGQDKTHVLCLVEDGEIKAVAHSPEQWLHIVGHAPNLDTWDPDDNELFEEDEHHAPEGHEEYMEAFAKKVGALKEWDDLREGLQEVTDRAKATFTAITGKSHESTW